MKLAEALILRVDYHRKVKELRQRLAKITQIQEDETLVEDTKVLLAQLEEIVTELEKLIKQINLTNSQSLLEENVTVSHTLAQRDILKLKCSVYSSLIEAATYTYSRYGHSEIKYFSTTDFAEIQSQVDRTSKQYRELDTKIKGVIGLLN